MKLLNKGPMDYSLATESGYINLEAGKVVEVSDDVAQILIGKKSTRYDIQAVAGNDQPEQTEIEQTESRKPGRPRTK